MPNTQDHLKMADIKNDLVVLKDGGVSLVLQTSAVNFGLLSEEEQVGIIYSFAGLLNSLSFAIQIVIRSERLDVSEYINKLRLLSQTQKNPLLVKMINSYTEFTKSVIKDNEVLDKQFYIVLNTTNVEVGVLNRNLEEKLKRALTILTPRKEHLVRQLSRVGLKAKQLNTEELVKLYYDIYNGQDDAQNDVIPSAVEGSNTPQPKLTQIPQVAPLPRNDIAQPVINRPQTIPVIPQPRPLNLTRIQQPAATPAPTPSYQPQTPTNYPYQMPKRTPFIVEELND